MHSKHAHSACNFSCSALPGTPFGISHRRIASEALVAMFYTRYITGNLRPSVQSHHLTSATLRLWPPLDCAWSLACKGKEANDFVLAKPRCYWRVDSPHYACQTARS